MNIILYGPPGVGKSTVGQALAARLGREFVDTDPLIEARTGLTIGAMFVQRGEAEFRRLESAMCAELAAHQNLVIALGGGALLDAANRTVLERGGLIVCLRADGEVLLARLAGEGRPLLSGGNRAARLMALLAARRSLYDSFPTQIDTDTRSVTEIADEIARLLMPRTLSVDAPGLKHEIRLGYGLLDNWSGLLAEHNLHGPTLVVTDANVAAALPSLVTSRSTQGGVGERHLSPVILPAGESHKTLDTIRTLYEAFLRHGLDRSGLVVALGGGVIGDLAGFAAATFMRGVRWVNIPTTLLAMVDASLGGKTGVDLPQGKNLIGAFHSPALIVADPLALNTLPPAERISGMAEVVKHGLIGDPALFAALETSIAFGSLRQIQQAIEVKIRVVEADPFEMGERAKLNLGHTVGHGVEVASGYELRHGEAVAIGLCSEAHMAERMGLAESGLTERITRLLYRIGLPTCCPGLNPIAIRSAMSADKKKAGGRLKFSLPKRLGDVIYGIDVDEHLLIETLETITDVY